MVFDDAVDEVVLLGLLGAHEVVAIGVVGDLLEGLFGVFGEDLVEAAAHVDDLLGVDLDVGRLAFEAGGHLVDEDLGVGQRHPLSRGAAGKQQRAHAHRDADADRLHVGLDELHRVVDRQACVDRAAGRVDVEADVLVGVLGLQVQELGHDQMETLRCQTRGKTDLRQLAYQGQEVLSHALRRGWGPADIEEVIVNLKASLGRHGIAIAATPMTDPRLRLDEGLLDEILLRFGFSEGQRAKDRESLMAIHQLRGGQSRTELGQAGAIFITSNDRLVKAGPALVRRRRQTSAVPQCVPETSFTTQLWLRNPEGRPNVARKFLVAESFAALNPSPELWERYLDRIAQRRDRDEINEE